MLQFIINSIRNKFELLLSIIGDKIDILKISEKKLDELSLQINFSFKNTELCANWMEMIKVEG